MGNIEQWTEAAKKGDLDAQVHLARAQTLEQPEGPAVEEGVRWARQAADKSSAEAQFLMAQLHNRGIGVEHDTDKAAAWLQRAAEQGHLEAMYALGCVRSEPRPDGSFDPASHSWFLSAAEKGHIEAQYLAALGFQNGQGVAQSYAGALLWFEKAAAQGHPGAMTSLGYLHEKGLGTARNFAAARRWYEKGANGGNATALYNLGVLCDEGRGKRASPATAAKLFREAAEKDHPDAQLNLANMLFEGRGVAKDQVEAATWYLAAAKHGVLQAQFNLHHLYMKGIGVEPDVDAAVHWIAVAAERGMPNAQWLMGVRHLNGEGVARDHAEAMAWFARAAEQDFARAKELLAAPPPPEPADADREQLVAALGLERWVAAVDAERLRLLTQVARRAGAGFSVVGIKLFDDLPVGQLVHQPSDVTFHLIPGGSFAMGFSDEEADRLRLAFDRSGYQFSNAGAMTATFTSAEGVTETKQYEGHDERPIIADFLEDLRRLRPVTTVTVPPFLCAARPLDPAQLAALLGTDPDASDESDSGAGHITPAQVGVAQRALRARGWRLCSEAEWEHAARAGRRTLFPGGDAIPHDVTTKPNRFGLDRLGAEPDVCADHWYRDHAGRPTDGGPRLGGVPDHVVRGGAAMMWPWQDCGEWLTFLCAERAPDRNHEYFLSVRPACTL
jgi:TPR repeat protein